MKTENVFSLIGFVFGVVLGGLVYHLITMGSPAVAASTMPTMSTSGYGALIGGLASIALPNMPGIGPWVGNFFSVLESLFGFSKKLNDAIPQQLFTDVVAILVKGGGNISLADIQKLITDFEQVDPIAILNIIKEAISGLRGIMPDQPSTDDNKTATKSIDPSTINVKV